MNQIHADRLNEVAGWLEKGKLKVGKFNFEATFKRKPKLFGLFNMGCEYGCALGELILRKPNLKTHHDAQTYLGIDTQEYLYLFFPAGRTFSQLFHYNGDECGRLPAQATRQEVASHIRQFVAKKMQPENARVVEAREPIAH